MRVEDGVGEKRGRSSEQFVDFRRMTPRDCRPWASHTECVQYCSEVIKRGGFIYGDSNPIVAEIAQIDSRLLRGLQNRFRLVAPIDANCVKDSFRRDIELRISKRLCKQRSKSMYPPRN